MVLGEIGEDGGVHLCRIKAVLSQADGRGLHSARRISFVHQATQSLLKNHGVRRRQSVENQSARLANTQSAHHSTALAQVAQGLRQPPGGRGLAVGASDCQHRQVLAGLVKVGGSDGSGIPLEAGVSGHTRITPVVGLRTVGLYQAGRGAFGQHIGHVTPRIGGRARPGHKTIAAAHMAAVRAQRTGDVLLQPTGGRLRCGQGLHG